MLNSDKKNTSKLFPEINDIQNKENPLINSQISLNPPPINKDNSPNNNNALFITLDNNPFWPNNYQNKEQKGSDINEYKNKNLFIIERDKTNQIINENQNEKLINCKIQLNQKNKCPHKEYFCSYHISKNKNENGLMCYDCLYKYYRNCINHSIPIKVDYFQQYKKYYKECISLYKEKLENKFAQIIELLEILENEEINDISTLLEEKLDLNFLLPVEIPFPERLEIAINRKLSAILEKEYINIKNYNASNLFSNKLKDLYNPFSCINDNNNEIIKLKSSVEFNLLGFGIPRISEQKKDNFSCKIFKENILLKTGITFLADEEYDKQYSLVVFDKNSIKIYPNVEYRIEFNGIKYFNFISNREYNIDSSKISSNKKMTILAFLIIE